MSYKIYRIYLIYFFKLYSVSSCNLYNQTYKWNLQISHFKHKTRGNYSIILNYKRTPFCLSSQTSEGSWPIFMRYVGVLRIANF